VNILGITNGGDSGVALFQNGDLVLAVNEERLSRIKLDDSYPDHSIAWCLDEAGLAPCDIDLICYGFTNGLGEGDFTAGMARRLQDYAYDHQMLKVITERLVTESAVDAAKRREFEDRTRADFPQARYHFCYHHEAHQSCAFMASRFTEALVVTSDGRGDFKSLTVCTATARCFEEIYHAYSWESLGYFYGRITHLCGFKANRHEGKILGLAAHGNSDCAAELMEKMISFDGEKVTAYPGVFYSPFFSNYSKELEEEVGRYSREDLAASAQKHLEQIVCGIVEKHVRETGLKNVCLAGGVFTNVKLNQRIRELSVVDDVFVYPNMGDGGICAGAVYNYLWQSGGSLDKSKPINTVYLGPEVETELLCKKLECEHVFVDKPDNIYQFVVEQLKKKKTFGLVQGRTEFGPRALGNRSILARGDDLELCDSINDRLGRSEFMPFAPVIAADLAFQCLVGYKKQFSARHMTITYDVTDEFERNSPAVVHVDKTVRPQVVFEEDNPFLLALLKAWYAETGGLCLVNTSFNLHEDPIVSSTDDIVYTFLKGAVDYLLFPPYIAECK
jgi:carbamoyltransferase